MLFWNWFFVSPFELITLKISTIILLIGISRSCLALPINDQNRSLEKNNEESSNSKSCDFNTDLKTYEVSDFLRCVDDLAGGDRSTSPGVGKNSETIFSDEFDRMIASLGDQKKSFSRSYDRQRQGPYGFYGEASPPFRPERPIDLANDPFEGGFYNPERFPDGDFGSQIPSGLADSALADALASISRYDDLKCVPRLLCEISSGSNPGKGDFRASSFENFGKNTLIGLLTSYNFERASPLLGFAKAALLGYANRDDSSICYQEYRRCPKDRRDLIHYLNNHNGGFFRFFGNSHRSRTGEGLNRALFLSKRPAPPPGLSGPESDRTGTGELKFDTSEASVLHEEADKSDTVFRSLYGFGSKVVFPDEKSGDDDYDDAINHRIPKSLEPIDSSSQQFFPASDTRDQSTRSAESSFFPKNDDRKNDEEIVNIVIFKNDDQTNDDSIDNDYKESGSKYSGAKERPDRASDADSVFKFPGYQIKTDKVIFYDYDPLPRQYPDVQERTAS